MKKLEVISMLGQIAEAKHEWAKRITEFNSGVDAVMSRLLHEAARNYMSAEEVARASGFTVKRVRQMMRDVGLNPRDGKNLLSKKAAEALNNNAALLGIEPNEMDLMSPLAYLPMGEQMRRELQDRTISKVTEFPETVHGINYWDDEVACHISAFDPVLITADLYKITCPGCREMLVRA